MGLFYNVLFFMGGVALHASLTQRAQPPSASLLEQADCSRVQLSAGRTCYRLDGPEDAPLVVLVHGFSGSHLNWAKTRESLVAAEFRVLSYDLYGRGFSDGTSDAHSLHLFVSQLAELVLSLGLNREPFVLAGISMGGPIAGAFARTYPSLVKRLLLIAPAGLHVDKPVIARVAELPLFGEAAMHLFGKHALSAHLHDAFTRPEAPEVKKEIEAAQRFNDRLADEHPSRFASLLSTMRNFPLGGAQDMYADLGTKDVPTLVVWGKQDIVVATANSKLLAELLPHASFAFYDNCGHVPMVEAREAFTHHFVAFARDGSAPQ